MVGMIQAMMGYGAPLANLTDHPITGARVINDFPPPATLPGSAQISFNNNGTLGYSYSNPDDTLTSGTYPGEWLVTGVPADFELSTDGGSTWSSLATTRTFSRTVTGTTTLPCQIRRTIDLAVVASATMTLTV